MIDEGKVDGSIKHTAVSQSGLSRKEPLKAIQPNPSATHRDTYSRMSKARSSLTLNGSRNRASTISLGNLVHYSSKLFPSIFLSRKPTQPTTQLEANSASGTNRHRRSIARAATPPPQRAATPRMRSSPQAACQGSRMYNSTIFIWRLSVIGL